MEDIKNKIISKGDIINNHKIISDVYYKEIGKEHKKRRYFQVMCLKTNDIIEMTELSLKHGKTGACRHCRSNEGRLKGNPQNHNTYIFADDFVVGYTNSGDEFYFDKDDYDLIKKYTWHINVRGYVESQRNKKKILMHRLIMNANDNIVVDHKNKIRNYNLKENLNLVTKLENNQNHSMYKTNTSGATGVSWDKLSGKWRTYISINKERIYGGLFDNINDAINNRKDLEEEHFKYLQSIKENKIVLYE